MFQALAVIFLAAFVAFGATMFAVTAGIGPFTPPAAAQVVQAAAVEPSTGPSPLPPPPAASVVIPPLPRDPVLVRQLRILLQLPKGTDMMALAEYFSKKKWPSLGQPQAPADVAARAHRANGSVGCTGCHQASYLGEGTQPRLAGQWKEYLLQSALDFRTRKRANNPGMSDLMKATSEELAAIIGWMNPA